MAVLIKEGWNVYLKVFWLLLQIDFKRLDSLLQRQEGNDKNKHEQAYTNLENDSEVKQLIAVDNAYLQSFL